jgi:hypothetical protein
VRSWYAGYGDSGIDQVDIFNRGNEWVRAKFPLLDWLKSCAVLPANAAAAAALRGGDARDEPGAVDALVADALPSLPVLVLALLGVAFLLVLLRAAMQRDDKSS